MRRVFFSDMKRILKDYNFYIAILGVAIALIFSLESRGIRDSVLNSYFGSVLGSGVHIAGVFCAFAFATVFCEDFEHKYLNYQIIRSNIKKYLISKVIMIYLSAVVVMILGTFVYLVGCRIFVPWCLEGDSAYELAVAGSYGGFVKKGHYIIYCLLYSLQLGLFMGMLALMAAYFSLFSSNTILVLILPMLVDQILMELPTNSIFSFLCFEPITQPFTNGWQSLLYSLTLSMLPSLLLAVGIYKRIKSRL